ncbi:MAG: hypothetical protein S4CHLAM20_01820 [Chlamydiia bacterium]|nr:hypothetical protein [Chlamydiia bacterium]
MKKWLLIFCTSFSCIYSIELKQTDVFLESIGFEGYKISSTEEVKVNAYISFFKEDDISEYSVVFSAVEGLFSSGNDDISYKLADEIKGKENKWPLIRVKEKEEFQVPLSFILPSGKCLTPGTYVAEVPIKIMKKDEIISERIVSFSFMADEQLDAKVYMNGASFSDDVIKLNFGEINSKSFKELSLVVKANTKLSVSITSKNNGHMILEGESEIDSPYSIPYVIESEGKEFSLISQTTLFSKSFQKENSEIRSSLKFLLKPDMDKTFCGKYKDRVYLTISSL